MILTLFLLENNSVVFGRLYYWLSSTFSIARLISSFFELGLWKSTREVGTANTGNSFAYWFTRTERNLSKVSQSESRKEEGEK
ncbi:hypothetical protein C4D60_Mb00t19100 [Musa balbisiana]|uniref:Uncharacterized protein n=1 Tax=Musa balbisiana TaxID=52838 RepID=A0A4S8I2A7_MUSBA|nr:hypothetical protein C4D60_Mb00t19100 [Musa balbisiana]